MKKFNLMSERQMSKANGGLKEAVALLLTPVGFIVQQDQKNGK